MHTTEKAPSKTAATAAEGKDQNQNNQEKEPIVKNATSLPDTTDTGQPAWADATHFDEIDGSVVGFSKVIADTDTLNATLFTDYSTALGNHDRLACDFKLDSALDFLTPDQVFEFAQDLVEAASRWVELLHESDQGNAVAGEDL